MFRMHWSVRKDKEKPRRVRIFTDTGCCGVLLFTEKEFGVFSSFALINTTLIEWLEERGDQ